MRKRAIAAVMTLALSATPVLAGPNGSLDLFNNLINPADGAAGAVDFGNCGAPVSVLFNGFLGRVSFSLYARLAGASAGGIAGAECYLDGLETGLPAGWTVSVVHATGITHVGDLVRPHVQGVDTNRRDTMTWSVSSPDDPNCQGGVNSGNPSGLVLVARIDLTSPFGQGTTFTQQNYYVRTIAPNPPTNPNFPCPFVLQCNSPIYTPFSVTVGAFIINPNPIERCTVAVTRSTWSGVKSLYR